MRDDSQGDGEAVPDVPTLTAVLPAASSSLFLLPASAMREVVRVCRMLDAVLGREVWPLVCPAEEAVVAC